MGVYVFLGHVFLGFAVLSTLLCAVLRLARRDVPDAAWFAPFLMVGLAGVVVTSPELGSELFGPDNLSRLLASQLRDRADALAVGLIAVTFIATIASAALPGRRPASERSTVFRAGGNWPVAMIGLGTAILLPAVLGAGVATLGHWLVLAGTTVGWLRARKQSHDMWGVFVLGVIGWLAVCAFPTIIWHLEQLNLLHVVSPENRVRMLQRVWEAHDTLEPALHQSFGALAGLVTMFVVAVRRTRSGPTKPVAGRIAVVVTVGLLLGGGLGAAYRYDEDREMVVEHAHQIAPAVDQTLPRTTVRGRHRYGGRIIATGDRIVHVPTTQSIVHDERFGDRKISMARGDWDSLYTAIARPAPDASFGSNDVHDTYTLEADRTKAWGEVSELIFVLRDAGHNRPQVGVMTERGVRVIPMFLADDGLSTPAVHIASDRVEVHGWHRWSFEVEDNANSFERARSAAGSGRHDDAARMLDEAWARYPWRQIRAALDLNGLYDAEDRWDGALEIAIADDVPLEVLARVAELAEHDGRSRTLFLVDSPPDFYVPPSCAPNWAKQRRTGRIDPFPTWMFCDTHLD